MILYEWCVFNDEPSPSANERYFMQVSLNQIFSQNYTIRTSSNHLISSFIADETERIKIHYI